MTAQLFSETIGDAGREISSALGRSFEGNAFNVVRLQLYRLLILDTCAAFLDGDKRSGSIRAVIANLKSNQTLIDALRSYYGNPNAYEITVTRSTEGPALTEKTIESAIAYERMQKQLDRIEHLDSIWLRIDAQAEVLDSVEANRLLWARDKTIAHWEKSTDNGELVLISDVPTRDGSPIGSGPLTIDEPLISLRKMLDVGYDLFELLTGVRWSLDFQRTRSFYARVFWDRFKNGRSEMKPPAN
jgi:hypothetical protein